MRDELKKCFAVLFFFLIFKMNYIEAVHCSIKYLSSTLNKSSSYRDDDLKFEGFPCSVAAKMTRV